MTTSGRWIGASYVLGRDVLTGEPYPHVCQLDVTGTMTGARSRLQRRDCAACLTEQAARRAPPPAPLPPVDDDTRALEARRLGEHE
jgi:hypothetical protein